MATVNFLYRSKLESANLTARLLFRHGEKDFVFDAKIKQMVTADFWKKKDKKIRDVDFTNLQIEINNELNEIRNHILTEFNNIFYANKNSIPTIVDKNWLTNTVEMYYSSKSNFTKSTYPTLLVDFFEHMVELKKNELTDRSLLSYFDHKKKIERFESEKNRKLTIKDLDNDLKLELIDFMKEKKYSNNYIKALFKYLYVIWNYANKVGIDTSKDFDPIKLSKESTYNIYLTLEEIDKIEKIDIPTNLIDARDFLIISCYTGQRISDFMRFNTSMIREEEDVKFLEFTQQKTGKKMSLPLHPRVLKLLKNRGNHFPKRVPENRYNDEIKEVCRIAGINEIVKGKKFTPYDNNQRKVEGEYQKWELVSSHIGRRSFATNFYGKIPTTYLIYATGHSTESQFLNYIGKSNKDLGKELFNYFK